MDEKPDDWKEQILLWGTRYDTKELFSNPALMKEFTQWCNQPWVKHAMAHDPEVAALRLTRNQPKEKK